MAGEFLSRFFIGRRLRFVRTCDARRAQTWRAQRQPQRKLCCAQSPPSRGRSSAIAASFPRCRLAATSAALRGHSEPCVRELDGLLAAARRLAARIASISRHRRARKCRAARLRRQQIDRHSRDSRDSHSFCCYALASLAEPRAPTTEKRDHSRRQRAAREFPPRTRNQRAGGLNCPLRPGCRRAR